MATAHSTLFFVNTRETAEWIASRYRLWDENISLEVHHGSLSKESRADAEDRFKSGELKALICTSSLELGIDIGSADLVIQFNSPREVSRMIQRAGRAGHRSGGKIRSVILAVSPDELAEASVIARKAEARELEHFPGRKGQLAVLANQLVAMTVSERTDRDTAYRIITNSSIFSGLTREDFDAVINEL